MIGEAGHARLRFQCAMPHQEMRLDFARDQLPMQMERASGGAVQTVGVTEVQNFHRVAQRKNGALRDESSQDGLTRAAASRKNGGAFRP